MKRSEMVEHIAHELLDIAESRAYSNESNQSYYARQASGLLAMIEGFGMLPPEVKQDFYDRHNNSPAFMSEWEKEYEQE